MSKKHIKNNILHDNNGFTLIEIAIGMVILGLIMTPLLALYNIEYKQRKINETQESFRAVHDALKSYVAENDIFPMPASLIESEAVGTYGQSVANTALPNICPDLSTGVCASGDGAPTYQGDVVIGFVPFATLQIEEDYAYDSWGNKLIYVVTVKQAVDDGTGNYVFDRLGPGGVQLQALDNTGNPVLLDGAAEYNDFQAVLVSTGPTGKGGFNADGNMIQACIEIANAEYEDQNCSFTANTPNSDVFLIDANRSSDATINPDDNGTRSEQAGPTFYDDYTYEIKEINVESWDKKDAAEQDIVSTASRLGIGEQQPETALHLRGDLLATDDPLTTTVTEGKVQADILSDLNLEMATDTIVGTDPNMNCFSNSLAGLEPVVGMGNNRVFCASPVDSGGTNPILTQPQHADTSADPFPPFQFDTSVITPLTCNTGDLMTGINSSGAVTCITPTP